LPDVNADIRRGWISGGRKDGQSGGTEFGLPGVPPFSLNVDAAPKLRDRLCDGVSGTG
jgi:hypothetical protein